MAVEQVLPESTPVPSVPVVVPTEPPSSSGVGEQGAALSGIPTEPVEIVNPSEMPSLLEGLEVEGKKDVLAPDAPAKKEGEPAVEPPKAETPPVPEVPTEVKPPVIEPVAWDYKIPETLKVEEKDRTELNSAFEALRVDPNKGAQALIDMHNQRMTDYDKFLRSEQMRVFGETRKNWNKEIMADPEMGGSGYRTAMSEVAKVRDMFVTDKDRPEFDKFLRVTGAGDHPAFIRFAYRIAQSLNEPRMPPDNPKPPPNNGMRPKRTLRDVYNQT